MGYRGGLRGQATQIGFVLMFGMLVVGFSTYQATVIPEQNKGIELDHNQQVQNQMLDIRNNMLAVNEQNTAKGSTVTLAPEYPIRVVGMNPSEPPGRLHTIGTGNRNIDVTFRGADVVGSVEYYPFNTGVVLYTPDYNEYPSAPETVYDQTTVYNKHRDEVSRISGQALLNGRDITLVYFESDMNRVTTRTVAVDVKFEDINEFGVEADDGSNLQLEFHSYAGPSHWEFLEDTAVHVDDVDGRPIPNYEMYRIVVDLDNQQTYSVDATKVSVRSRIP